MKATGIVRRIDELGRVVIPKEIRRTQRIRKGDALEIFTAADGQVVFKKYSPLVELGELAGVYAEVLAKNLGRPVLMCDRESIVAATGTGKGQLLGRQISDAAARLLAMRGPYTAPETAARRITAFDKGETVLLCVCLFGRLGFGFQFADQLLLVGRYHVLRSIVVLDVNTKLFRLQIADMTIARHNLIIFSEELFNGFCLSG